MPHLQRDLSSDHRATVILTEGVPVIPWDLFPHIHPGIDQMVEKVGVCLSCEMLSCGKGHFVAFILPCQSGAPGGWADSSRS